MNMKSRNKGRCTYNEHDASYCEEKDESILFDWTDGCEVEDDSGKDDETGHCLGCA